MYAEQARAQLNVADQAHQHIIRDFGIGYAKGLDESDLQRVAPAIFAEHAHQSRSERYGFVSTLDFIRAFRQNGFFPVKVNASRVRQADKNGFQKHQIRFRREDQLGAPEAREVILTNSHDGSSGAILDAGLFRLACANGLMFGENDTHISVPHRRNAVERVIEGAYTVLSNFDEMNGSIERMKAIQLNVPQKLAFAKAAAELRFEDAEIQVNPIDIIAPRRQADVGNDLWRTFNVVQERLIKGGVCLLYTSPSPRDCS